MKKRDLAFCWRCRHEFSYPAPKEFSFDEPKCPKCKSNRKVTTQGGNPHKDRFWAPEVTCKGKWWLKSKKYIHSEAVALTYECSGCGEQDLDVAD